MAEAALSPAAPPPGEATGVIAGCNPDCHGCRHRDLGRAESLAAKGAFLARVLGPWQDRLAPVRSVDGPGRLHYRDRVSLSARWQDEGWRFGLIRRDELVPIPDCPVHTARVRELVHLLMEVLPPPGVFPLGWLHVAGAQATLVVKHRDPNLAWIPALGPRLSALGLEGLWVNAHPSAGRKLFLKTGWRHAWGARRSRDTTGLLHGPGAFQQLLPVLHGEAVARAAEFLAAGPARPVLDLYCGHGSTLRQWRARGAATLGVESSREAVECARENAPGAQVLQGSCRTRLPQVRAWWQDQAGRDSVAWVNPDRLGLEAEVCVALGRELRPARLAYLSCSAGTLKRDLAVLAGAGYRVEQLIPFDFFPRTHHVEVLALLGR